MQIPLLLVEDTPSLSLVYETVLKRAGHDVNAVPTIAEAEDCLQRSKHNIILLDLTLPDGDGLDLMTRVLRNDPKTKVIVITANGSINRAVEAMRGGAFDFLVKPFDEHRLLAAVENALEESNQTAARVEIDEPTDPTRFLGFIGSSPIMHNIYSMVRNIGKSTATVFITGDSGTGKEVCAQAIHQVSNRAKGPFIALNCGAIPKDLLESEVFGHLRGSFTGAIADKKGAAAAADGGTLFLDEICEMDLGLQTKLLRFLQTSTIQPVGATTPRRVDVRIVCATNRDPVEEVRAGRFREDLFYRLHVVPIFLPPLKDRQGDVLEIAEAAIKEMAAEEGKHFSRLSPEVRVLFTKLPWPGNVRQLLNVLRNVLVLHDAETVELSMLPPDVRQNSLSQPLASVATAAPIAETVQPAQTHPDAQQSVFEALVGQRLEDIEKGAIEATIASCNGSIPAAASILGISPSTIYRKRDSWDRKSA